jgi:hypothetical protein
MAAKSSRSAPGFWCPSSTTSDARVLVFGALLSIGSAHALTVAYTTKGPMWYSWGIVPSETELHRNIAELIASKVSAWIQE